MAENKISNTKIRGAVSQGSDVPSTKNTVESSEAESVDQKIVSQGDKLRLGRYSASGRYAVLSLLAIALAYLAYRVIALIYK